MHVERDDKIAKYWLEPMRLESSGGFDRLDLSKIFKNIEIHKFHPVTKVLDTGLDRGSFLVGGNETYLYLRYYGKFRRGGRDA